MASLLHKLVDKGYKFGDDIQAKANNASVLKQGDFILVPKGGLPTKRSVTVDAIDGDQFAITTQAGYTTTACISEWFRHVPRCYIVRDKVIHALRRPRY